MGTVFDIQRCSVNDGPGLRTVIFLKGCGKCASVCACHDFSGGIHTIRREKCTACGRCADLCPAGALEVRGKEYSAGELLREIVKDRRFYEKSGGGVTVSGGEPLFQPAFLAEILRECKAQGIHTAVETSGFASREVIAEILPLTDLFLWDYKATENSAFFIGAEQSKSLRNLDFAAARNARIRLRCPIIPGVGDNDVHLRAISELSKTYPFDGVDILPYHNMGVFKSQKLGRDPWDAGLSNMTDDEKNRIARILSENGCRSFTVL